MEGSVDIINSTLGKALGGAAGGYTTGEECAFNVIFAGTSLKKFALAYKELKSYYIISTISSKNFCEGK